MRKFFIILIMFFSYFVSYGQSHPGGVSGVVKDSEKQFVPGATYYTKKLDV